MQLGIRIQKVFSDRGILSRRKTEAAIEAGRITVNGRPASLGQRIDPKKDIVTLDGKSVLLNRKINKIYLILYKPRGYITSTKDAHGRRTVIDLLDGVSEKVYPVGRLDLNSEGLLLLTNDGDFANDIMHPSGNVSKTYRVTIKGVVTEDDLIKLSTGVVLDDGYKTQPAIIHVLEKYPQRTVLQFTVYEGRNRLIRRMCTAVRLDVIRLKRTSIGSVKLGMLQPGEHRELKPSELNALKGAVRKSKNRSRVEEK